jgi:hypothetical protein
MQLWSDQSGKEYAIRLQEDSYITPPSMKSATTIKNNIQYTRLIEESDYLEDIEYNWNYTLMHWINGVVNRDNNWSNLDEQKTASLLSTNNNGNNIDDDTTPRVPPSYLQMTNNKRNTVHKMAIGNRKYNHNNNDNNIENKKQTIPVRLKGSLQCHFCKLMFSYHKERKKHEQTWHFSNVKSKQQQQHPERLTY